MEKLNMENMQIQHMQLWSSAIHLFLSPSASQPSLATPHKIQDVHMNLFVYKVQ